MSVAQTTRLAREVAAIHQAINAPYFYGKVLRRTLHRQSYPNSDVTVNDLTLWHQAEYAVKRFTPEDLQRQADELAASTLEKVS